MLDSEDVFSSCCFQFHFGLCATAKRSLWALHIVCVRYAICYIIIRIQFSLGLKYVQLCRHFHFSSLFFFILVALCSFHVSFLFFIYLRFWICVVHREHICFGNCIRRIWCENDDGKWYVPNVFVSMAWNLQAEVFWSESFISHSLTYCYHGSWLSSILYCYFRLLESIISC